MQSYWTHPYLIRAFQNIDIGLTGISMEDCWGHTGQVIRIKIMKQMAHVCSHEGDESKRLKIIGELKEMLDECNRKIGSTLTSPAHTKSNIHRNEAFDYFDISKMKILKIETLVSAPKLQSFNDCKAPTQLIYVLKGSREKIEERANHIEPADTLIERVFNGENALSVAIRFGHSFIASHILKTFGKSSLSQNGFELIQAFRYKNKELASHIIDVYGVEYPEINKDSAECTILMLAIEYGMEDLAHKIIDKYDTKCEPSAVSVGKNTALIIACKNKMSSVAIKLLEKFGLDGCKINQENNLKQDALFYAKRNGMVEVVRKYTELKSDSIPSQKPDEIGVNKRIFMYYNGTHIVNLEEAIQNYINNPTDEAKKIMAFYL